MIGQVKHLGGRVLLAAAAAGTAAACVNAIYMMIFEGIAGRQYSQTGLGSVVVSSLLPPLLGGAGVLLLARLTRHAGAIFAVMTWAITLASLLPAFSPVLPDGAPKPPGFDALVLPMHIMVGASAAWAIPRALKEAS